MPSTKPPKAAAGSSQTSTSIAAPASPRTSAGTRRREGLERIEAIARRGARAPHEPRAALGELAIERQARHVRAAHDEPHCRAACHGRRLAARAAIRPASPRAAGLARAAGARRARQSASSRNAGASSVTPKGRPSARKPAGTASRRQVEQVHEVGVGAELAVEPIGSASTCGQRVDRRRAGSHDQLDPLPGLLGAAAQLLQAVERGRRRRRRRRRPHVAITRRVTGCIASGLRASRSRTASQRSATQGPSYSSRAVSIEGRGNRARRARRRAPRAARAPRAKRRSDARVAEEFEVRRRAARRSGSVRRIAGARLGGRGRGKTDRRGSKPCATSSTARASPHGEAEDRHAVERAAGRHHAARRHRPSVGFNPTRLLNAAGTRPEPAVSVPSEKLTSPAATATAEPELEPPEI